MVCLQSERRVGLAANPATQSHNNGLMDDRRMRLAFDSHMKDPVGLQRTAGNRATAALVRSLVVQRHESTDKREDASDQVVARPPRGGANAATHATGGDLRQVRASALLYWESIRQPIGVGKPPLDGSVAEVAQWVAEVANKFLNSAGSTAGEFHLHQSHAVSIANELLNRGVEQSSPWHKMLDGKKKLPDTFEAVVSGLGTIAGPSGYAIRDHLLALEWGEVKTPRIRPGATQSEGYFTGVKIVAGVESAGDIVVDPTLDALAALDTILYESQNALQGKVLQEAVGERKAEQEFVSLENYIRGLFVVSSITNDDARELCVQLGVPELYLVPPVAYSDGKNPYDNKPVLPSEAELKGQNKRSALWWYLTGGRGWDRAKRVAVFVATEHAPGMASSGATYSRK